MSCNTCKESKYNILLTLTESQKKDTIFLTNLKSSLQESLGLNSSSADSMVSLAVSNFPAVISSRLLRDEVSSISVKLAKYSIPHEVKNSKY